MATVAVTKKAKAATVAPILSTNPDDFFTPVPVAKQSTTITLDDNVPMPTVSRAAAKLYPWDTMDVGQSFFVPNGKTIGTQASKAGAKYGVKFTCRKVTEHGVEGVRVWRTA